MPSGPLQLSELRQLLAERFPPPSKRSETVLPTEIISLDRMLGGGIPTGALTEIISPSPSSGGQLFILQLLIAARTRQQRIALIDAMDAFDPGSHCEEALEHLVWIRCHQGRETAQAADILLRDANFSLVIIDVRGMALAELRLIPATTWYRLQRAVESTAMAVVVQSTFPLVPSAQFRFQLTGSFKLDATMELQRDLVAHLGMDLQRNRKNCERSVG